ncbi:MAG: ABC transporter permease [bacterium]
MKKYLRVISNVVQESAAYRLNHFLSFLCVAVPLLAIIFLWRTIYSYVSNIKGYNESMMITYYLLSTWLADLTGVTLLWEITSDIKDGNLSVFLLRPMSYQLYQLSTRIGANLPYSLIGAGIIVLFAIFLARDAFFPSNLLLIPLFLFTAFLSFLLAFQFSYLLSLSAFWLEESSAIQLFLEILMLFLSGALLPLNLFPTSIYKILTNLPFQYLLYFPINIYLGKLDFGEISKGITMEVVWIIILQVLIFLFWRRGIRRYSAVGG